MTNNVFGIFQYVHMYSHFFIDINSTKLTYGRMRHIIKEKPAFQDHIFIKLNCVWVSFTHCKYIFGTCASSKF